MILIAECKKSIVSNTVIIICIHLTRTKIYIYIYVVHTNVTFQHKVNNSEHTVLTVSHILINPYLTNDPSILTKAWETPPIFPAIVKIYWHCRRYCEAKKHAGSMDKSHNYNATTVFYYLEYIILRLIGRALTYSHYCITMRSTMGEWEHTSRPISLIAFSNEYEQLR